MAGIGRRVVLCIAMRGPISAIEMLFGATWTRRLERSAGIFCDLLRCAVTVPWIWIEHDGLLELQEFDRARSGLALFT